VVYSTELAGSISEPARACGVFAAAVDVGRFFHPFARGAAVFAFGDLARTIRMSAFLRALNGHISSVMRGLNFAARTYPN
jgi:hypothetical protein